MLEQYRYIYHYTITFMVKDTKFRIKVNDIYCAKAYIERANDTLLL
jgi:hypothetical protein